MNEDNHKPGGYYDQRGERWATPNDIETIATEIAPGVDPDSSAEEIAEMVVQLGYSIHTALHVVQHFGRLYCGCGPSWNYGGGR
jgi:hypothetical protein|tara:strand:- start:19 stop:270 length:252 start_codon:yes stop_codon:yes gene_type:complete